MRRGVIGRGLVAVSVLILAVGCGDPESAGDTTTVEIQTVVASPEARWIESSKIEATLAEMRRDVRSFIRRGSPAESLVYSNVQNGRMVPQYGCAYKLGGRPPTAQLTEVRRQARRACDHLQRALEASQTFRATTIPGGYAGGDREGAAQAARQAKAPLAKAMALLEAARG